VDQFVPYTFTLVATDNCDPDPTIFFSFEDTADPDAYTTQLLSNGVFRITLTGDTTTTVTATAADSCGNLSPTCVFTITAGFVVTVDPVWVDDDWTTAVQDQDLGGGRIFGVNAFETIQRGVNAVTPGGNVYVANGLYTEAVFVPRPLRMWGESRDGVIHQARATGPVNNAHTMTVNALAGTSVTLSQMTFRNGDYGVMVFSGNVRLLGCALYHNGYDGTPYPDPPTPAAAAAAYSAFSTDGGAIRIADAAWAEIHDCLIYENDRGILYRNGDALSVLNTVIEDNLQTGIQLDYTAGTGPTNCVLDGNTISQNKGYGVFLSGGIANVLSNSDVSDNWNTGVHVLNPADCTIGTGNTVTSNSLYTFDGRGAVSVSNGGIFASGPGLVAPSTFALRVLGTTVSSNGIGSLPAATGIYLDGTLDATEITLSGNTVTGQQRGIWIGGQAAATQVLASNIAGNALGVQNDDAANLNATTNWWGSYAGSSGLDPGGRVGDPVLGPVTYLPWSYGEYGRDFDGDGLNDNTDTDDDEDTYSDLEEVYVWISDPLDPTKPMPLDMTLVYVDDDYSIYTIGKYLGVGKYYGYNAFATIQNGVDVVASGGVVQVADGLYGESVVVDWPMTIQGPALASESAVVQPTVKPANAIIEAVAGVNGVHIQNMEINGLLLSPLYTSAEWYRGIYFADGSQGSVTNCLFTLTTAASFGLEQAAAIETLNASVAVDDNLFADFHKYAVLARNSGTVHVRNNVIVGTNPVELGTSFSQNGIWYTDDSPVDADDPQGDVIGNVFQDFGPSGPPNPIFNNAKVADDLGAPVTGICLFIDWSVAGTSSFAIRNNAFDNVQTAFADYRILSGPGYITSGDILSSNTMANGKFYAEGPLAEGSSLYGQRCDDPNFLSALMAGYGYGLYTSDEMHVGSGVYALQDDLLPPDDLGTPGDDPILFLAYGGNAVCFLPSQKPAPVLTGPNMLFWTYNTVSDISTLRQNAATSPTIRIVGPVEVTVGTNDLDADSGRNRLFIQDTSGADGQTGIAINDIPLNLCTPYRIGDRLGNLVGLITYSGGLMQVEPLAPVDYLGSAASSPPLVLTGTENFEDIESELIRLNDGQLSAPGAFAANTTYPFVGTTGGILDALRVEDGSGIIGIPIWTNPFPVTGVAVENTGSSEPLQIWPRLDTDVQPPTSVPDWNLLR
jgi:parallel beta-helix repeat protein